MDICYISLEVHPPKLNITEEGDSLIVNVTTPKVGKTECWKYYVCYKQCSNKVTFFNSSFMLFCFACTTLILNVFSVANTTNGNQVSISAVKICCFTTNVYSLFAQYHIVSLYLTENNTCVLCAYYLIGDMPGNRQWWTYHDRALQ